MTNYTITIDKEEFNFNEGAIKSLDVVSTKKLQYHVVYNDQSVALKILSADFVNKTISIEVNGNTYEMKIEDEYDRVVEKMGLLTIKSQRVNNIKAPMPGLIIDIMAIKGQKITVGTPLMVLSAMKMENIITSHGEGTVKNIKVDVNDVVEKGQIIIEMEQSQLGK